MYMCTKYILPVYIIFTDPISYGTSNQGTTTIISMDLYSNVRSYEHVVSDINWASLLGSSKTGWSLPLR